MLTATSEYGGKRQFEQFGRTAIREMAIGQTVLTGSVARSHRYRMVGRLVGRRPPKKPASILKCG